MDAVAEGRARGFIRAAGCCRDLCHVTTVGRRPKRLERYEGGEKARYYKDDDVDLQTLVKRTKYEASL